MIVNNCEICLLRHLLFNICLCSFINIVDVCILRHLIFNIRICSFMNTYNIMPIKASHYVIYAHFLILVNIVVRWVVFFKTQDRKRRNRIHLNVCELWKEKGPFNYCLMYVLVKFLLVFTLYFVIFSLRNQFSIMRCESIL